MVVQVEQLGGGQRAGFRVSAVIRVGGFAAAAIAAPVGRRRIAPVGRRDNAAVRVKPLPGTRQPPRRLREARRHPVGDPMHRRQQQGRRHYRRRRPQRRRPLRRQHPADGNSRRAHARRRHCQRQRHPRRRRAGQHRYGADRTPAQPGNHAGPAKNRQRYGQKQ